MTRLRFQEEREKERNKGRKKERKGKEGRKPMVNTTCLGEGKRQKVKDLDPLNL
jgi:hypothetical protein